MDAEVDEEEVYEFRDYRDPPRGYQEPAWSHLVVLDLALPWAHPRSWFWWNQLKDPGRSVQNAHPAEAHVWMERRRVTDQEQIVLLKVECWGDLAAHLARAGEAALRLIVCVVGVSRYLVLRLPLFPNNSLCIHPRLFHLLFVRFVLPSRQRQPGCCGATKWWSVISSFAESKLRYALVAFWERWWRCCWPTAARWSCAP